MFAAASLQLTVSLCLLFFFNFSCASIFTQWHSYLPTAFDGVEPSIWQIASAGDISGQGTVLIFVCEDISPNPAEYCFGFVFPNGTVYPGYYPVPVPFDTLGGNPNVGSIIAFQSTDGTLGVLELLPTSQMNIVISPWNNTDPPWQCSPSQPCQIYPLASACSGNLTSSDLRHDVLITAGGALFRVNVASWEYTLLLNTTSSVLDVQLFCDDISDVKERCFLIVRDNMTVMRLNVMAETDNWVSLELPYPACIDSSIALTPWVEDHPILLVAVCPNEVVVAKLIGPNFSTPLFHILLQETVPSVRGLQFFTNTTSPAFLHNPFVFYGICGNNASSPSLLMLTVTKANASVSITSIPDAANCLFLMLVPTSNVSALGAVLSMCGTAPALVEIPSGATHVFGILIPPELPYTITIQFGEVRGANAPVAVIMTPTSSTSASCAFGLTATTYTVGVTDPVVWVYCTSQPTLQVIADLNGTYVLTQDYLVALDFAATKNTTASVTMFPPTIIGDKVNNLIYLCVDKNIVCRSMDYENLLWEASIETKCLDTILSISDDASMIFASGETSDKPYISAIPVNQSVSQGTMYPPQTSAEQCSWASFVTGKYTRYGTPIYVSKYNYVIVPILYSNCLQIAYNFEAKSDASASVLSNLLALNFTSYITNESLFYDEVTDMLVAVGMSTTMEQGAFAIPGLLPTLCFNKKVFSCVIDKPTWDLPLPSMLAINAFGGYLYTINTFFVITFQCVHIGTGKVIWQKSLDSFVPALLPQLPTIYQKANFSICVVYGMLLCTDGAPHAAPRFILFSNGEGLFGQPIFTEVSVEVFLLPSRIYSINFHRPNKTWSLGPSAAADFGADCASAHARGDSLFALCSVFATNPTNVTGKRIFMINLQTGALVLSGGPFAKTGQQTFAVSLSTGHITVVTDWLSLLVITLNTVPKTTAVEDRNYFCSQSDVFFFSFATNWNGSGFAGRAQPFNVSLPFIPPRQHHPKLEIAKFFFREISVSDVAAISDATDIARIFSELVPSFPNTTLQYVMAEPSPFFRWGRVVFGLWGCSLCIGDECPSTCSFSLFDGSQQKKIASPPFLNTSVKKINGTEFYPSEYDEYLIMNQTLLNEVILLPNAVPVGSINNSCSAGSSGVVDPSGPLCFSDPGSQLSHRIQYIPQFKMVMLSRLSTTPSLLYQLSSVLYPLPVFYTYPANDPNTGTVIILPVLAALNNVDDKFLPGGTISSANYYANITQVALTVKDFDGNSEVETYIPCTEAYSICPQLSIQGSSAVTTQLYSTWYFASRKMNSIVWKPSGETSQWRSGHATLERVYLLSDFRQPQKDTVGGRSLYCLPLYNSSIACPSQCIPDFNSCSSILSYDISRFVYSYLKTGNPNATLNVLANVINEPLQCLYDPQVPNFDSYVKQLASFTADPKVTIACQNGRIRFFAVNLNNTVLMDVAENDDSDYFGINAKCSPCEYFLIQGVASQPLLMMLAASIKSLAIVMLTFRISQNKRFMKALHSRYARVLTKLANFRFDDELGKADFRLIIEGNFAPPVVSFEEVTARLNRWLAPSSNTDNIQSQRTLSSDQDYITIDAASDIYGGDRNENAVDASFVEYYYTSMCEGQAWIIRETGVAPEVVAALMKAFDAFQPRCDFTYKNVVSSGEGINLIPKIHEEKESGAFHKSFRSLRGSFKILQGYMNKKNKAFSEEDLINDTVSESTHFSSPSRYNFQEIETTGDIESFRIIFTLLRKNFPESFEYVLLPNRVLENRLAPLPFVIIFNIFYCTIFLLVCIIRVFQTRLSWFDQYQVVFYLFFNSTAVGSLVVDCFMRPILLRRSLRTDPYIKVAMFFILVPTLTHCIPGATYYAWVFAPLVGIPIAFEAFLRTRQELTTQRWRTVAFLLRSTSRIMLVFATCAAFSMSYNYAALGIYTRFTRPGQSAIDIAPQTPYLQVPSRDFESRSFLCITQEWSSSTAAFLQHFATLIGLF